MPFVALEGKFPQHPKLLDFSRADRFTWVEILCYCAEYRTEGRIPKGIQDVIRQAKPEMLHRFADAGLLDISSGMNGSAQFAVHDWDEFNGTGKERRDARERKRRQRGKDDTGDDIPF